MSRIWTRRGQRSQGVELVNPALPLAVNLDHPYGKNLIFAWKGGLRELVTKQPMTLQDTAVAGYPHRVGGGWGSIGGSESNMGITFPTIKGDCSEFTLVIDCLAGASAYRSALFGGLNSIPDGTVLRLLNLDWQFYVWDGSSNLIGPATLNSQAANTPVRVIARLEDLGATSRLHLKVNDRTTVTSAGTFGTFDFGAQSRYFSTDGSGSGQSWAGEVYSMYLLDAFVPTARLPLVERDPHALLRPANSFVFPYPVAAAGSDIAPLHFHHRHHNRAG